MLIDELKAIVGDNGWTTAEDELEPHLTERRGAVHGHTLIMLSPASADEVSAIIVACASAGVRFEKVAFAYEVHRGELLLATGSTQHLWIEAASHSVCRAPEELREPFLRLADISK